MAELDDLSTTDASNTARFPENMLFRNVNDSARALEGMIAREFKDRNMSLTSTGSSNAFAVTPNRTIASLADGLIIGFTANHSITGAATLNVSGLGARPIVSSNGSALASGDIVSGQKLQVVYRSATADFQMVGDRASGTSADMTARVFPVGGIIPWPTSTAPTGWLLAYGQAVSRTTYAELFAVYGTTYGSGDGSTTFNLPDYRGRVPFGKDDMGGSAASRLTSSFGPDGTTLGATGGAQSTTLAETNLPGHTHGPGTLTTGAGGAHNHPMFGAVASAGDLANATENVSERHEPGTAASYRMQKTTNTPSLGKTGDESAHTHSVTGGATASTGSGTAFSNVPPAIVQNWIILALPAAASAATLGVNGLLYQWSAGTTDINPGSGKLALNNATVASATQLYISETDAAGAGMGPVLALWDDSTSTIKGTLYIYKVGTLSTFAVFTISGTMTDGGAYDKFTLTHVASGGTFAANDQLAVLFVPKGDKGDSAQLDTDTTWQAKGDLAVATGNDAATILPVGADGYVLVADSAEATGVRWAAVSGTGDVTAASNFATDNRLIRSDGTGKGVQASGVTVDDSANVSGIAALSATTIELGHASDTTLARSGAGDITIEGNAVYRAGGTDVALADGGTGASLTDPNADRVMFWDDSAGAVTWLEVGSGLSITGTTLTASGASGDVTAAAAFATDNRLIRSDGTGKGVQASGIDIDDGDVMTTPGRIISTKNGALDAPTIAVTGAPVTGGTATTTKPLVLIETTGATSTGWNTSGTALGVNAASGFSGRLADCQLNGVSQFSVSNGGAVTTRGSITLSLSGNSITWTGAGNTLLTSPAAATLQLGSTDVASPVAQTVRAQGSRSGTDSNAGGANLTIQSGTGTGTGTASSLILRSPVLAASGTTAQTQTTGLTITNGVPYVPSYTVAGAPSAATAAGIIYVSNETGGAVLAFSDGTNWRRVTDRAIIA